jgi:hypothetical protein
MLSTKELLEQYGGQIERVISESPDPNAAMEEIAFVAERRGLIESAANLRRESPLAFVMDLWLENPVIRELLNLRRERFRDSKKLETLTDVFDVLP